MALMSLTFSDVYTKVSEFLGFGSSPTGTNLTKCKDLVYRGYRRFLFPTMSDTNKIYTWSFLRNTSVINTVVSQAYVDLPKEMMSLVSGFKFISGENKTNPIKISMALLKHRQSITSVTGLPLYYAIRPPDYELTDESVYRVYFSPTPDAVYSYSYEYVRNPEKPTSDSDYFVGGTLASEVILESALAEAEVQEDDNVGVHQTKAKMLIESFVEHDKKYSPTIDEFDTEMSLYIPKHRLMPKAQV